MQLKYYYGLWTYTTRIPLFKYKINQFFDVRAGLINALTKPLPINVDGRAGVQMGSAMSATATSFQVPVPNPNPDPAFSADLDLDVEPQGHLQEFRSGQQQQREEQAQSQSSGSLLVTCARK
jgi:hypothetical protein